MYRACVEFSQLPWIGFAHHFYMEEGYTPTYGKGDTSFELVYVHSGGITGELYGQRFLVQPGSLLVLFRHLPIRLYATDGVPQSHCSVQLIGEHTFSLLREGEQPPEEFTGVVLPFIVPPGKISEAVKPELLAIVSEIGADRKKNAMAASLRAMGVLARLNALCRNTGLEEAASSSLDYRIKRLLVGSLDDPPTLQELADRLHKSPNYLNDVFHRTNGISIHRYINRERVRVMAELMENKGLSFREACRNVGVEDTAYGYRLFKKQLGVTPGEYLQGALRTEK